MNRARKILKGTIAALALLYLLLIVIAYLPSATVPVEKLAGADSKFVKVNELFDVFFCQVADCDNTTQHLSVFNDVFEDYFWNILNDGVRNVQVRLYPRQP